MEVSSLPISPEVWAVIRPATRPAIAELRLETGFATISVPFTTPTEAVSDVFFCVP